MKKALIALSALVFAATANAQWIKADGGTAVAVTSAVGTTRTISTTSPLAGGGDLSANRTFSLGIVPSSLGGLGADESAATGIPHFTAGTVTVAGIDLVNDAAANQSNVNSVLHGNGAGQPSFGAVVNGDFSGTLATNHGGLGADESAATGLPNFAAGTVTVTPVEQLANALLASVPSVDLNTATPTLLYTCPTGKSCVITSVVIRAASTSLTTASVSFGWNSATFNDVIADAVHTELTGSTLFTKLDSKAGAALGTSTGTFEIKANTLQGAAATCTVDVLGYVF